MFKKSFYIALIIIAAIVTSVTYAAAQAEPTVTNPADIVALLMPVVVWLASAAVNWLKSVFAKDSSGFGGSVLVFMVVPIISFISAYVYDYLAQPDLSFWIMFLLGFVGTFLNEAGKQWTQTTSGTQDKVTTKLLG